MSSVINTNIASLTAQRNLASSQSALTTSLERLSSGLRINSAKDDAAGLAISDRMTSQINGLNQAVRNANDGISLAQTAEGSLSAVSDNLQRIRELALQSANATNSATDRDALNSEVQELLSEIQRVSETTQFNGLNLLDGTFSSAQFQIGANANQTISISISGSSTSQLGAYQAASTTVTSAAFDGAGFTINGVEIGASAETSAAGVTADSATAKATAINAKTNETSVSATASNTLTGTTPTARSSLGSGVLEINGVTIGAIAGSTNAVTQGDNAATAINSVANKTGVSATVDRSTGALTLSTTDGRNIELTASTANAANADAIYNATGLDISAGSNPTGNDTMTLEVAGAFDMSTPDPASLTAGDTFVLDGLTYEFVETGNAAGASNVAIELDDGDSATDVATEIARIVNQQFDAGATSVSAGAPALGVITFTNTQLGAQGTFGGYSETVHGASTTALVETDTGTGTSAADGLGVTSRGSLTLSSANSFVTGGVDIGFAGLSAASASLTTLSSVNIDTISGSNDAIAIIDGALSQISSQRAKLGAYQNRFESVVSSLTMSSENLSSARSRIQDADYASETAALTRAQILQQAGTAMLSQANSLPNTVLSLLQ